MCILRITEMAGSTRCLPLMKPSSRLALTAITHGLALAVGWAIYQASGFQQVEKSAAPLPSGPTKAADRLAADPEAGREILAAVLKSVSESPWKQAADQYDQGANNITPETRKELRDRIDSIEIPENFAAALEGLMPVGDASWSEQNYPDAAALVFHWLSKDPQAFFEWIKGGKKRMDLAGSVIIDMGPELYRRVGVDGVLSIVGSTTGYFRSQMYSDLGRSIASACDTAGVSKAKAAFAADPQAWQSFALSVGSKWPNDKLAELVDLAVECDDPMIAVGHRIHHKDQGAYIASLLADDSLPEDFRRRLSENQFAREGLVRDLSLPLETRLQNGGNVRQLVNNDVDRLLGDERDWSFAFRNGEATAQEIMDLVAAGTPELAKSEPDALRMHVFRELAEENPAAAMVLLKDLPDDERSDQALYAARTHFTDVEPQKFLEFVQQIPADTPEQWDDRLDTWNLRGFTNYNRLQDGYVDWVQALPPGLDREMALYSLARVVNESDPKLAANLRSQVTDSALQKRISKHR